MTVHILACLLLILVVLLQAGRGAGLAMFGSGGDAVFASPSGSSFLKQFTAVVAGTFAVTSLMLTLLSSRSGMRSVTGKALELPSQPAAQNPQAPKASAEPNPAAGKAAQPATPQGKK